MDLEMLELLEAEGMDKWASRFERCGVDYTGAELVCSCRAIKQRLRCNLKGICQGCGARGRKKLVDGLIGYFQGFPLWNERKPEALRFLTFTQENCHSYSHGVFLLKRAIKKWRRTLFGKKVLGGIFSIQTTRGNVPGAYHVHAHGMVYSSWLENRYFTNEVRELGFNLSDLAYSWYQATDRHDYIVDVQPVTNRKKALEYILSYVFKSDEGFSKSIKLEMVKSQYKKRSFNRFGVMHNIKVKKSGGSICFDCGDPIIYVSAFELGSVNNDFGGQIYQKADPPPDNRCLTIYFKEV